jgi:hypothetical protein
MKRKPFVSIAFFPTKIQVLKVSSQGDKVEKALSAPIAPEAIVNYKVQNAVELTAQLKNIWKKENISEKSVGIVIPEFSTFTKLLKLPKLDYEELNEAVRWQSQEFLPTQDEVVLDWQIIDRTPSDYLILVVAVQQSILAGYVQAVGAAGLLPLVVETPSIALIRSTQYVKDARVIIFVDGNEAVITVAKDKAILASSVVKVTAVNDITTTASLMLRHYEEAQVKMTLVTGIGASEELIQGLGTLGGPVEIVKQKLTGFAEAQVQEYIIPLALQLKDNVETNNPSSINLLPPEWIKHYRDKLMDIRIWLITLLSSAILWIAFLGSLGTYSVLSGRLEQINSPTNNSSATRTKQVIEQIGEANNLIRSVQSVVDHTHSPQEVINAIYAFKPPGVEISSIAVALTDGSVSIKGTAGRSEILFDFREEFEKSADFSTPSLPIRNITQQTDIVFDLRVNYIPATGVKQSVPKLNVN